MQQVYKYLCGWQSCTYIKNCVVKNLTHQSLQSFRFSQPCLSFVSDMGIVDNRKASRTVSKAQRWTLVKVGTMYGTTSIPAPYYTLWTSTNMSYRNKILVYIQQSLDTRHYVSFIDMRNDTIRSKDKRDALAGQRRLICKQLGSTGGTLLIRAICGSIL